jgi:hypothetical protein
LLLIVICAWLVGREGQLAMSVSFTQTTHPADELDIIDLVWPMFSQKDALDVFDLASWQPP